MTIGQLLDPSAFEQVSMLVVIFDHADWNIPDMKLMEAMIRTDLEALGLKADVIASTQGWVWMTVMFETMDDMNLAILSGKFERDTEYEAIKVYRYAR